MRPAGYLILLVIVVGCLVSTAACEPAHAASIACGDANFDVTLTATDALAVLQSAVGGSLCAPCICDGNGDGGVTATDALIVLQASVGQNVARDCPACGPAEDADGDGLSNGQEAFLGTGPSDPDSDDDRIWDGEELSMFATMPLVADSDGDGMIDGADPQPASANNAIPALEYGVFTDNSAGTARVQIASTRYEQNHVVYAPPAAPGAPFLLYQTHLADGNQDGKFDEADIRDTAIAIMNIDGSRPRLLTDLGPDGLRANDGAIDATPEPSPDGQHIIFVSNRHDITGFQLRLYVMDIDGGNPVQLGYVSGGPAPTDLDADPHWGPGDKISFKREDTSSASRFSRVYTADLDTTTMMLANVTERTDGTPQNLALLPPGDYDPKISPDGAMIASYRHLTETPGPFGDWDVWVGRFSDPAQPTASSITFLDVDANTTNLFPRWNLDSTKLAMWRFDSGAPLDPIDIVVFDLDVQSSPFSVSLAAKNNITAGEDWFETMPSWNTDPAQTDTLIYSGSR